MLEVMNGIALTQMPNTRIVSKKNEQQKRHQTLVPFGHAKEANAFMRPTHDYCSPTLPRKERTFWFCFEPFLATCGAKMALFQGFSQLGGAKIAQNGL